MEYKSFYLKVYKRLLMSRGKFNLEKATIIAFKASEMERTKEEIIKVAVSALDEAVAKGLVNVVDDDVYESIFSDKNINQDEDLEK